MTGLSELAEFGICWMVCVLIEAPKRIFHFVDSNPTFWGGPGGSGAGKKGVKLNFQKVCHVGYQTLAFDTTNLSKLFMIQIHSAFGLQRPQRPQWRDIGGQNGGQIETSCKHIMWGIKLLLLIPQTYLSYFRSKWMLCLASNDLNGVILEVKMEVESKVLVSISCGVSNSGFWYHKHI